MERENERRAQERQQREAELQRLREAEIEQRAREDLRRQEEQAERDASNFKPYMPRIWPRLTDAQVKKKDAFLKKLRSERTMRKRAQGRSERVETNSTRIDAILLEAWRLHREAASCEGTA